MGHFAKRLAEINEAAGRHPETRFPRDGSLFEKPYVPTRSCSRCGKKKSSKAHVFDSWPDYHPYVPGA